MSEIVSETFAQKSEKSIIEFGRVRHRFVKMDKKHKNTKIRVDFSGKQRYNQVTKTI